MLLNVTFQGWLMERSKNTADGVEETMHAHVSLTTLGLAP